jgi:hypothetical protein
MTESIQLAIFNKILQVIPSVGVFPTVDTSELIKVFLSQRNQRSLYLCLIKLFGRR